MPTIEQLEELLEKDPQDPFLNFGLAMALRSSGKVDDALGQFDRTLEHDPDYVAAYFHKAQLLAQVSRIDDAKRALETGIDRAASIGDDHARSEMTEYLESLG